MLQLTHSEKCLAGALLLSIVIGVSVRHYRHLDRAPSLPASVAAKVR